MMTSEICGAWGGCTLSPGHNMGRPDIPENHHNCSTCGCGYCDGGPCCQELVGEDPREAMRQCTDCDVNSTCLLHSPAWSDWMRRSMVSMSEEELAEVEVGSTTAKPKPNRVQIHVTLLDGTQRWYPVGDGEGWKIDSTSRCIIIGKGLGRTYIPFDNVDCFSPEAY